MATYKVIQDIEAEDKLLGPLTFRQFIYGGICIGLLYLSFLTISKGVGFMAIIFAPPGLLCGFFAWPWGRDQPTEVWALAKVRFMFKPRKRLWDQNGVKELVTVTAPKKVEEARTNGLSRGEVQSRLQALANTIDSRGWAIKNVNVNLYAQPTAMAAVDSSDRLIDANSIPLVNEVADFDVRADDDMLDEHNNPQAARVDTLIAASTNAHRQQLIQQMQQLTPQPVANPTPQQQPAAYWFLNQPTVPQPPGMMTGTPTVVTPQALPIVQQPAAYAQPQYMTPQPQPAAQPQNDQVDEAALMQTLKAQDAVQSQANAYGHLHTLQPLSAQPPRQPAPPTQTPPPKVTPQPNAAILQTLARNDDLNVATIAREAQRSAEPQEVVISLH